MTCHAGAVVGMAALRTHPILITTGEDGALQAYNTDTHVLLARYQFPVAVSCLLYPPIDVRFYCWNFFIVTFSLIYFADGRLR